MKKEYQKPEVELVELETEVVMDEGAEGETGNVSNPFG